VSRQLPEDLRYLFDSAAKDSSNIYKYACELCRIVNSDSCKHALSCSEIENIKNYANSIKSTGSTGVYSKEMIEEIENSYFGPGGLKGYLNGFH